MLMSKVRGVVKYRVKSISLKIRASLSFLQDLKEFRRQTNSGSSFQITKLYPITLDKYKTGGLLAKHYFEQDLFVAQRIFKNNPQRHVDIGSRVDGFVAHVAAFRKIEIIDIRPMDRPIRNVISRQADLMRLPSELINYTDSISSLHVLEHFGLGRYGDPIDINGYIKALDNIYLILKEGGKFYFSVPIGKQGVEFNAHRIFNVQYLTTLLKTKYNIDQFNYIDDNDFLHHDVDPFSADAKNSFGCRFGCGLFELSKFENHSQNGTLG